MNTYIGLDVHAASTTFAVIHQSGRRLGTHVVETSGQALVAQLKAIAGRKHVCLEEGTQSGWLYEILSPWAERVVVATVPQSRGQKSDERDAFHLAEQLRTGALKNGVFKEPGAYRTLRELGRTHAMVVQDVVRVQNRIKALYRSRGIAIAGKSVYSEKSRKQYLDKLPDASRGAAETLHAQYDAVEQIRRQAEKDVVTEAHRHPISRVLETGPGLGPIRVAQLIPIVVSPGRFRTKRQFWSYCGLGIVMRSSSDWVQNRHHEARSRPLASGLQAADGGGHQAESGQADDCSQDRRHHSFDVEEQGEVRPDEALRAKLIARLTCGNVNPRSVDGRWRSTWRRATFEGEYPWTSWPGTNAPEVPGVSYAPSEYQKKQWPEEVQIGRWFP